VRVPGGLSFGSFSLAGSASITSNSAALPLASGLVRSGLVGSAWSSPTFVRLVGALSFGSYSFAGSASTTSNSAALAFASALVRGKIISAAFEATDFDVSTKPNASAMRMLRAEISVP
jgi:hypothetical protein